MNVAENNGVVLPDVDEDAVDADADTDTDVPGTVGEAARDGTDRDGASGDGAAEDGAVARGPVAPAPPVGPWRLRVVAGPQTGAVATLPAHGLVSIGSAPANDVVLRGAGVAARHALLTRGADGRLGVDVVGAPVAVAGETLGPGDSRALMLADEPIALGPVAFVIESAAEADGGGAAATLAHGPANGTEWREAAALSPHLAGPTSVRVERAPRRWPLVAGALAASLCLGGAALIGLGGAGEPDSPPLAERLAARFPGLAIGRDGEVATVEGYVPTRDEEVRLRRWIAAQPEALASRVRVEAELGERVLGVLRVNGVEATLVSVARDAVVIETAIGDAEALAEARATVERDVPALGSLEIRNVPPAVTEEGDGAEELPFDKGKRVALVVADDPAYIVTEDRSRYFLGALLPSGHRIASIEEGRVTVEKGGVLTELRF